MCLAVFSPTAQAGQPRSNYGLTVVINDSSMPVVGIRLQLDPLSGDGSYAYWAENMTANVTLGSELAWTQGGAPEGTESEWQSNVSGVAYFNYTSYLTSQFQQNLIDHPNETFFITFNVTVRYTDQFGSNPLTIIRKISSGMTDGNYVEPPPPPFVSLSTAALLGLGGAGAIAAGTYIVRRGRLQELYLMHDSGMLIRHWSRSATGHDSDIMSGMLIVLQEFVRDTWKSQRDEDALLEQMRFGGQRVLLARGAHTVLAAVVQGRYLNGLPRRLQETVLDFEQSNATVLANWNGNVDLFPKVDQIAQRFLRGGPRIAA